MNSIHTSKSGHTFSCCNCLYTACHHQAISVSPCVSGSQSDNHVSIQPNCVCCNTPNSNRHDNKSYFFVLPHPVSNVEEYHRCCNAIHLGNFRVKSVHHLSTSFPCDMYSKKIPSLYSQWERKKYKVQLKVFKIPF